MPTLTPVTEVTTIQAKTMPPSANIVQGGVPNNGVPAAAAQPAAGSETVPRETQPKDEEGRFRALTKKEQDYLRKSRELTEREKELARREAQAKDTEIYNLAKVDPLTALSKLGITYDDITNRILQQNPGTPEQIAKAEAAQLVKQELESFKKAQEEQQRVAQQQAYQQALAQIRSDAEIIAKRDDKFPLVKESEAFDTVRELIEQTFHEGSTIPGYEEPGKVLPTELALEQVELFLEEQTLKLANIDKVRSKLSPQAPQEAKPAAITQQPTTLTHKTTVAPPSPKPMTAAERRKRAEDVFYGRVPAT